MSESCVEERRFLVLTPTGRDGPLTRSLLERAGLSAFVCSSIDELCRESEVGAAGLILAEEVLTPPARAQLVALVAAQEPWSDLPILIFTGEGATIQARVPTFDWLAPLGNVTLLDRPVRPLTMLTAARTALGARLRQYQSRQELVREQLAVRQRDQFLAMLGHELRNPLGVILLAVELITRDQDVPEQIRRIHRQGLHLARLVDDLLDVSRITTGKIVLQRVAVDLDELARRCVESVQALQRHPNVGVTLLPAPETIVVQGDAVRLEQIFVNLITNAVKYSQSEGNVVVVLEAQDDHACVRIRDDGVGIAPEMLPHVFDLFAQADRTLDRAQGGLGIGLTLVRGLVELHGGVVEAHSPGLGKGSEFVVQLPRFTASVEVDSATSSAELDGTNEARRILIIEDSPDARELLKEVIESLGHTVDVAENGDEGVKRALAARPDAVVIDIGLPGIDGYEVARRLRSTLGAGLILVALTGYGQPEDRRRAFEAGFDRHCTKPIDAMALRSALRARA